MIWRLIQFIFFFAIFLLFMIFNLENKCDISFGFKKVENIPVFITVFITFIAGMLCTLPFVLTARARKKEKTTQGKGLLAKAEEKLPKKTGGKAENADYLDKRHYGID